MLNENFTNSPASPSGNEGEERVYPKDYQLNNGEKLSEEQLGELMGQTNKYLMRRTREADISSDEQKLREYRGAIKILREELEKMNK